MILGSGILGSGNVNGDSSDDESVVSSRPRPPVTATTKLTPTPSRTNAPQEGSVSFVVLSADLVTSSRFRNNKSFSQILVLNLFPRF